ncbi:unnamed protein product [Dibothriocephalus latus]|uniref:Uncharacterized protein n=1 Tax=Dibothriocephalus latus TaxID=60516 RepID=A0A3P7LWY9_DIBLA|nr:unnamed protein product [Dibothriocephalus latus]
MLFCEFCAYSWAVFVSFSAPLARFCKPFVCSVVYGYDIIPRLSIPTLNDLKWRLFDALANCKIPKYQLLCRSAKLLFLRCCLPCCAWPMIGLDTKLLDEKMQQRILNPEVYQARISSYSTSSEPSEIPGLRSRGPLLTASSPPAPGGRRVSAARSTNHNCAPGDVPSYSRFRPGPRSLVCWLKDSGPLILKTAAPGTEFCPPYADLEGNVQPQWSEFSSTSAPTGEYASAASYEELVSMDRNVKFAGVVLHIVEADDCLSAAESSDFLDVEASSPWLPENHQQKTSWLATPFAH